MFGMFFFLTQFLQDVLDYSPLKTGVAFLPLTVALFAASQLSAASAHRPVRREAADGRRHPASAIGLLLLTGLSEDSSYP